MALLPIYQISKQVFKRYFARIFSNVAIPGPQSLPVVGHLHLFSGLGPFRLRKFIDAQTELFHKFGPVVQLKLGTNMVLIFSPKDVEEIFRNESRFPKRPLFDALRKYRMQNPMKYKRMGLFTDNGEDWFHLRKSVNNLLLPEMVASYFSAQEDIASDFVDFIDKSRDSNGKISDFMRLLRKFSQEAVGVVCFGKRLGCLSGDQTGETINTAVSETLQAMSVTWLGAPWWKVFPTPSYRKLVRTQNHLYEAAAKSINEVRHNFQLDSVENCQNLLIYELLGKDGPMDDQRDVVTVTLELFQAGIEATASALGFTLHYLATNQGAQVKLRMEITENLKSFSKDSFRNMPYLKACVKESLRLSPPAGGNGRILEKSLQLSGYDVPPGILVVCCHPVMSRCEQFFHDADKFLPERWLRGSHLWCKDKRHAFVSLPFGFGARMCPGRRIAEQEIMLCLVKILQRYIVKHDGSLVGSEMNLNMTPDKPLDFTFIVSQ